MYRYRILIVDDDTLLQNSLNYVLSDKYDTLIAGSGEKALALLDRHSIDLVLLDIRLPGMDGVETLEKIRKLKQETVVVMMTAYEDVKTVIKSMKMGAFDYLVKPLDIDELDVIIEKALGNLKLKREVEELRRQYLKDFNIADIVAESEGMKQALKAAGIIARSHDTTVLVEGETGSGKEVIARTIQSQSARFGKPFISINCGAISRDLIESELFGYEKGSFTGGLTEGKKGKIELADKGILFLDEIGELLPSAQVKMLRFLEDKEFYRVGGTEKKKADVRIIAATNRKIETMIKDGGFRDDLYYRLNVAKVSLPPLREREADILPLTLFFMNKFNDKFGKKFQGLSKDATQRLLRHPWPGNVRELKNVIERVLLMEDEALIRTSHLAFMETSQPGQDRNRKGDFVMPPTGINLDELNRSLITQALKLSGGNRTKAARLLGMSRPTMIYRIEKYGLRVNGEDS